MARFHYKIVECDYASTNFNRYLNHTWDKYSLNIGFLTNVMYQTVLVNIKMFKVFRDILKQSTICSMKKYVKRSENHFNRDREIDLDENYDNENIFNDNDIEQFGHDHEDQDSDHTKNISFADFDHNQLIACFLLELREKYSGTPKASCFVSGKVSHILQLENKARYAMFQESIKRNNPNFVIDHKTKTLLT